jgi:tetratricopeptide (TPR) repeat protein
VEAKVMVKKVILLSSALFGLLFLGLPGEDLSDASTQLEQAETCMKEGQYQQAEEIYQQIITDYPGTDYEFQAQKNLVILYVTWDKQPRAEAALQELIDNFYEYEGIATVVTHIANTYRKLEQHQGACEIYHYVVDNWPGDEHGMWSQMGLVISNISLSNDDVAKTAFEKLRTEYSGYEHISRAVCLVADTYHRIEKDREAREHYQYVLDSWPDDEFALWSQMGLTISNIRLGDYDAAEAAIEKLFIDFFEDERIPIAVCKVADEYRKFNKHEKACEHYRYVVDNCPDAEHALWSQMGLAISNIRLGDYDAVEASIEKLFIDFSQDERMAIACCLIGDEYRELQKHQQALVLYQYVVDNWPDAEHAMWSRANMGNINIQLGDFDTAQTTLGKLLSDFSEHPILPTAVAVIGDGYYNEALRADREGRVEQAKWYYRKAIVECERILTQLPETPYTTAEACYFLAVCHEQLDEHADAIDYYQMVVDNWPDFQYTWHALFRIGCGYETLKQRGLMAKSEADAIIKDVYEQLLETYPTCKVSKHARRWLSRHEPTNQGESR